MSDTLGMAQLDLNTTAFETAQSVTQIANEGGGSVAEEKGEGYAALENAITGGGEVKVPKYQSTDEKEKEDIGAELVGNVTTNVGGGDGELDPDMANGKKPKKPCRDGVCDFQIAIRKKTIQNNLKNNNTFFLLSVWNRRSRGEFDAYGVEDLGATTTFCLRNKTMEKFKISLEANPMVQRNELNKLDPTKAGPSRMMTRAAPPSKVAFGDSIDINEELEFSLDFFGAITEKNEKKGFIYEVDITKHNNGMLDLKGKIFKIGTTDKSFNTDLY